MEITHEYEESRTQRRHIRVMLSFHELSAHNAKKRCSCNKLLFTSKYTHRVGVIHDIKKVNRKTTKINICSYKRKPMQYRVPGRQLRPHCLCGSHLYWSPMEDKNSPSSRHWIVGVAPGIELLAAQLNIAALPGTTTVSCGSSVNSSSDTPATKYEA